MELRRHRYKELPDLQVIKSSCNCETPLRNASDCLKLLCEEARRKTGLLNKTTGIRASNHIHTYTHAHIHAHTRVHTNIHTHHKHTQHIHNTLPTVTMSLIFYKLLIKMKTLTTCSQFGLSSIWFEIWRERRSG